MDPQVRAFLAAANSAPQPPIDTVPVATSREQFASLTPIFHPFVEVEHVTNLTTDNGIRLRVYHPGGPGESLLPGLVYFHGGGWVLGDLETHDTLCRNLAKASGAVVVAVDYRLAPEHPFPAAFDDAWTAVNHVVREAATLGIDSAKIAVAGDSAGGNLAAAVALKAREHGAPKIAMQCLIYPVLDDRCETESYREFADGFGLTRVKMDFFWKCYRGALTAAEPLLTPILQNDLAGLPPALIVTAEYDVLRDEGEAYAKKLQASDVVTELWRVDGMIHGFVHYAGAIEHGQTVTTKIGQKIAATLAPAANQS